MLAMQLLSIMALATPSVSEEDRAVAVPPGIPQATTPGAAGGDSKPDFPSFEDVTKEMKVREGFFTLYQDEKKDKLFARVPKPLLNKNFLLATSIARGRGFSGWQWVDGPVYWDRLGKKLVLMAAEPKYVPGKGSTVEDVIARTYTDWIIRAVPILTEVDGDPVIDLAEILKVDSYQFGDLFDGRIDRNLSRFGSVKNFEKNTEISVDLAIMPKPRPGSMSAGSSGESVGVHFSMSSLPETDYKPREADPRVGYFLTVMKDWTADHSDKTIFRRYINRWHLRKSEPDKDVSDVRPEDQIVFYIEKTVPLRYRSYVRDGILEWNKAFEAAGLRNAIAVRQQTDKNEYKDLDPEDVRYNFFRWMVTGDGYAMGPSRANPFTGQILDADIVWDDSMIRYLLQGFDVLGPKAGAAYTDRPVEELLARFPEQLPKREQPWEWLANDASADPPTGLRLDEVTKKKCRSPLHSHASTACELGLGAVRQLAFASLVSAQAGQRSLPEEFIGQVVKEIVMHEVGHTLGLRHNFKASSWLKLSDIKTRPADQATVGSVMDYTAFNYAATAADQGLFDTPTIGPYDYWAIEYGYKPFMPGKDDKPKTPAETASKPDAGETNGNENIQDATKARDVEKAPKDAAADKGPSPVSRGKGLVGTGKPAKADAGETAMLKSIASRCNEPGHAYATDEDTSLLAPDPLVNRWDNGDDPTAFAKDYLATAERLWKNGLDWSVKDGESWTYARRAMDYAVGAYGYVVPFVGRMVGGMYVNRNHKGDPHAKSPLEVVPAKEQREALAFVTENAFSDAGFRFSPELLNRLAPGRWGHWDSDEFDFDVNYDIHDRVLSVQAWNLFLLINPLKLNRVYDSQALVPADQDVFTVPELLGRVSKSVWSELEIPGGADRALTVRQPLISSYRRSLQRTYVQVLIDALLAKPGGRLYADVQSVVRLSLKDLGASIDKALTDRGSRLDEYTRAHLVDSSTRIKNALNAEFVANPKVPPSQTVTIRIGADGDQSADER